jgi:hypothetical protein
MNPKLNTKNIKKYLNKNPTQFRIFDIPYSEKTKKCLDNFKIEKVTQYTNYGDNNLEDLKDHLKTIGLNSNEDIELMDKTIKDLTKVVMNYNKKYDRHWLVVKTFLTMDDYSIKRWHCDDNYFLRLDDKREPRLDVSKFITILQGPGTFYLKTTPKERELYYSIQKEELEKSKMREPYDKIRDPENKYTPRFDMEYRKAVDSRIEGNRVQANKYQGAIFISNVNNINMCGIHSEPPFNVPRMLLAIVPCTKEEIELHKNKHTAIKVGGGNDIFYSKYLKYKNKYLALKRKVNI